MEVQIHGRLIQWRSQLLAPARGGWGGGAEKGREARRAVDVGPPASFVLIVRY